MMIKRAVLTAAVFPTVFALFFAVVRISYHHFLAVLVIILCLAILSWLGHQIEDEYDD